mgnify:CR=1 FL=1
MIAFLYAGQGSQKVGMGKDFYDNNQDYKELLDDVRNEAGFDIEEISFTDKDGLINNTRYTQGCLAAFGAGVTKLLYKAGIHPDYVAGLSLGEYSALHASGAFSEKELIRLVGFRGKVMQEAANGLDTKMSAILGLSGDVIANTLSKVNEKYAAENEERAKNNEMPLSVEISNYNCKGQIVISGASKLVSEAEEELKEAGAKRCVPLKVSSAFHTSYMTPASKKLREYFDDVSKGLDIDNRELKVPVLFNAIADKKGDKKISDLLTAQVKRPVKMEQTIKKLKQLGVDTIVEIGPGKTLAGFVRKTVDGIKVYSIDSYEDYENVVKEMAG